MNYFSDCTGRQAGDDWYGDDGGGEWGWGEGWEAPPTGLKRGAEPAEPESRAAKAFAR